MIKGVQLLFLTTIAAFRDKQPNDFILKKKTNLATNLISMLYK